jgi:methylated-DNA-[protein]-cysteine S-methyltransferase
MRSELSATDLWWPVSTPFGEMVLCGDEKALHYVLLPGEAATWKGETDRRSYSGSIVEAERQLRAYCSGRLFHFDLPLEPSGTEWQKKVWRAVGDIGFGETRSYADIAQALGKPAAARAVGSANHANPLPVVVPCHRVIGADGSLTGYGGGLDLKARLLAHERGVLARRA